MKATILDGSKHDDVVSDQLHDLVDREMRSMGWVVDSLPLRQMKIVPCSGCFGCWIKTPGSCAIKDDASEVVRSFIQSSLVVFYTPVTFGGYSSVLKKALDRLICLVSPFFMKIEGETHHKPRYAHYPILAGIGILPRQDPESEQIFRRLVRRNAINMHAPACATAILERDQPAEASRNRIRTLLNRLENPK